MSIAVIISFFLQLLLVTQAMDLMKAFPIHICLCALFLFLSFLYCLPHPPCSVLLDSSLSQRVLPSIFMSHIFHMWEKTCVCLIESGLWSLNIVVSSTINVLENIMILLCCVVEKIVHFVYVSHFFTHSSVDRLFPLFDILNSSAMAMEVQAYLWCGDLESSGHIQWVK